MKKSVEILATLLNKSSEEVNSAIEKDELGTLISEFKTNNQIFNATEFVTLKDNFKKEVISKLTPDDIPEEYKSKAVGWKMEKLETELKEAYQFTDDYKGLTDLVAKIVTKAEKPVNKEEVQLLKDRIIEVETEYKTKLADKSKEFDMKVIKDEFSKTLNGLGLDYEGDALDKQKELFEGAFKGTHKLDLIDGKVVVSKGEDILKDSKLDPIPLGDIVKGFAKDFGFQVKQPDTGGHGGDSSKGKIGLKGVSFEDYVQGQNIEMNTAAADVAFAEWSAANK